jgi:enamine deaminase RidA (YjgF/YER057c/UK114 family)
MIGSVNHGTEIREGFHTLFPDPADPIPSLLGQLQRAALDEAWPQVLEVRVFASADAFDALAEGIRKLPGSRDWPLTFLDGSPAPAGGVAGLQLHTVFGAPVETIRLGDKVVGRAFQSQDARYCVLGGLGPQDPQAHPGDQTISTLIRMEEALNGQGMELTDLARTWFFLHHILGWYGDFNEARTRIYQDRGIFQGYVPASTGIGGRNHLGSALVASALAVKAKDGETRIREVPSPLQCSAGDYGSSFSRAAELQGQRFRRLFVSGTASIDPRGKTAHAEDVEAQIGLTFRVVEAILASRGMGLEDVVRANAYFRDAADALALGPGLRSYGLAPGRVVVSRNTVCRSDLQFEMEVEASQTVVEE